MTTPDGRASRFSQLYVPRVAPLRDDKRMRERLYAILPGNVCQILGEQLQSELGVAPPWGTSGVNWQAFYRAGELRDVLDSITLASEIMRRRYSFLRDDYHRSVARIFLEQNVGYRIDEQGVVHFAVDEQFDHERRSTIAALDAPRYSAAVHSLRQTFEALDSTPPDGKSAVRTTFSAIEGLFRLMFPKAPKLAGAEIEQYLRPTITRVYGSSNDGRAAGKFLGSLKEWVEAAHFYRHEEGREEPAQPPLDLAIALISTGTGLLRWLAELDRQRD